MTELLRLTDVEKSFTLHNQDGITLPVFKGLNMQAHAGECVALAGPSGMGKSTLMRMIYGNYLCQGGKVEVLHDGHWIDIAKANARDILQVRRWTLGYISQFLRVVPRVSTLNVVAEPLIARGVDGATARDQAAEMLTKVNLPQSLWHLAPATFSGGEQQRVNIARGFVADYPIMLLDEPTASLDKVNREAVLDLIRASKAAGRALVGIFHDADTRSAVCDREFSIEEFKVSA
ncbi:MAG: phosphonate C-P lyase system protein PhnL [Alphaproteobacteria bacterium]|nr:phosphonate C-P lyase system protein PhnL [Alphaproteobacteria bacterium]